MDGVELRSTLSTDPDDFPATKNNRYRSTFLSSFTEAVIQVRYLHVWMAALAIMIAYMLRINMSVAIVAMTDTQHTANTSQYEVYAWSEAEKGAVLSSFFGGYGLLQIVAGRMAERYGSKVILTAGMSLSGLSTVIIPRAAEGGYHVVCALRVLQGAVQGFFFPSVMVLLSKWIPPSERSRAMTLTYSAMTVGTLIGFPLSGYLASTRVGWPSIFYVTGGIALLWTFFWLWIGASSAGQHSFISEAERNYIETSLQNLSRNEKKVKAPWKHILRSGPVWAIFVAHLGQNWANWTLLTQMPNFVHSVLDIDIKANGLLSALPYLCGWVMAILFSLVAHRIQEHNCMSKTMQRKMWNSVALWGGAIVLFALGVSNMKDARIVIPLFILTVSLDSGTYNGFLTNHVDVSPNFCGTLMGITNSLASVTSLLGPLTVGWIVSDASSQTQWKYVFSLTCAIMFGTNLFYLIFGSAEVQHWNSFLQA